MGLEFCPSYKFLIFKSIPNSSPATFNSAEVIVIQNTPSAERGVWRIDMAKVFVSYSRKDIDFAKRLTAELQKSELDFWIDWEGIPPTVDWWKEIEKGIEEADVFLFLISPDSATSKICVQEIDTAIKNGKRIIPIVVREIDWQETPSQLGHLNYIFFSRDDNFDSAIKKLLTAIHTDYEWAATHRRLQVKALEWQRRNKENSFLLRGKDLQDAEFQLATNSSKDPHPTDLQRELLYTSRKMADRQRRIVTSVSIVGVIVLTLLTVFSIYQAGVANDNLYKAQTAEAVAITNEQEARQQALVALSRQLAAQAQPMLASGDSKQMTAILLAIQSMKIYPSAEAAQILQDNTLIAPSVSKKFPGYVHIVQFSPDGRYGAVGGCTDLDCTQGTVWILDALTGTQVVTKSYNGPVYSLAFSPDGNYLVSAGGNQANVWETITGREISQAIHDSEVTSVAFSPDGKYVISGGESTALIWEAANGNTISKIPHSGPVSSITVSTDGGHIRDSMEGITGFKGEYSPYIINLVLLSPDERYVLTESNQLKILDQATGSENVARTSMGGLESIFSVAFSPDGKYILLGVGIYHIEKAIVVEMQTGNEVSSMIHDDSLRYLMGAGSIRYKTTAIAYSPNGKYVVSGGCDKQIDSVCIIGSARVWDPLTGKELGRITCTGNITAAAFSPDGKTVISGCENGDVSIWQPGNRNGNSWVRHDYHVLQVAFSPDSKLAASGGGDGDPTVKVWDLKTGKEFSTMTYKYWVSILSFSPDGNFILSGNDIVNVWDALTGREVLRISPSTYVQSATFNPSGEYILTAQCDQEENNTRRICILGSARIWELATKKEISHMIYNGQVSSGIFSPIGDLAASSGCDERDESKNCIASSTRIWDTQTGVESLRVSHPGYVNFIVFSPDGSLFFTSGCEAFDVNEICTNNAIRGWKTTTGNEVFYIQIENIITDISPSPDGRYLIAGTDNGSIYEWEISTNTEIAKMSQDGYISSITYSLDGKYIASGSNDYTARVWDSMTGEEVARMTHDNAVNAVEFSADGRYVISGSDDGSSRVWLYRSDLLISDACSRVTRNLTLAEWQQYIGNALPYEAICENLPTESKNTTP